MVCDYVHVCLMSVIRDLCGGDSLSLLGNTNSISYYILRGWRNVFPRIFVFLPPAFGDTLNLYHASVYVCLRRDIHS